MLPVVDKKTSFCCGLLELNRHHYAYGYFTILFTKLVAYEII